MKKFEFIKKVLVGFMATQLMLMAGCSSAPKLEEVENSTRKNVEALLTEDNNEELTYRMDDYFLTEQVDDLTYKGILRGTAFFQKLKWDDEQFKVIQVLDSSKIYLNVTIKYCDKEYEHYLVFI